MLSAHPLCNWIPYKLTRDGDAVHCKWLYTGKSRFTEPFFDETITRCRALNDNQRPYISLSSLEAMTDMAQTVSSVPPTAFIFHVSRCGSTLLSQFLGLNEQNIVLSEVPLLDELLRINHSSVSTTEQEQAFSAAIRLLGHRRAGQETRLFIKLDSWHIFYYETIRRLYPDVPIILLYRSPDEVVASHRKRRGTHAVPGLLPAAMFGFGHDVPTDLDEYTATVLSRYLERFLSVALKDDQAYLLNYQADGVAMMRQFVDLLHLPDHLVDWSSVRQRSARHAKYPDQVFSEKQPSEPIPDYLQPAMDMYARLSTL